MQAKCLLNACFKAPALNPLDLLWTRSLDAYDSTKQDVVTTSEAINPQYVRGTRPGGPLS